MSRIRPTRGEKGLEAEEALRSYFLNGGYYVARDVPFIYDGYMITDIDLWLYNRVSSVSRELTLVDVKKKKTPQAIERIFWTKGLQSALGVTRVIVATTDTRGAVRSFGRDLDVLVLDGRFLKRLTAAQSLALDRMTDEDFKALLAQDSLGKLGGDWAGQMRQAKSKLTEGLSFDTCNFWLLQGQYFAEQAVSRPQQSGTALRCLYLLISYAALAVDYILRECSFLEEMEREQQLRDGFIYGSRGQSGTGDVISVATDLLEQYTDAGRALSAELRSRIQSDISQLPANILSQHFAKAGTGKTLFEAAKELERLAFSKVFRNHSTASVPARSLIGCLLDFWGIERLLLTGSLDGHVTGGAQAEIPEGAKGMQNDR